MIEIELAFAVLKKAFKDDKEYAHSWHCNLACSFIDAGGSHGKANEGASRFMKLCFGVETSNDMLRIQNGGRKW